MKYFKENKIIGISLVFIFLVISVFIYRKESTNVFKDEYMKEIFVEDETNKNTVDTQSNVDKGVFNEAVNEEANNIKIITVEIKGEVAKPDVYELEENSIIKDLIDLAGGTTKEANLESINRAKKLENNQLIVVPNINDEEALEVKAFIEEEENEIISINNDSIERLMDIPGIGEVKANSIVEYREEHGGFKSIEELKNIEGIGDKTFEKIKDKISL